MVYDFFLPGLMIDALERRDASRLAAWAQETLDKLHAFDPAELSDSQKYDYYIYEFYLESLRDLYKYPNLNDMFRPYTG